MFDTTVVAVAAHSQTGLLVTGDASGVLCAWRWQARDGRMESRSNYTLFTTGSVPSRVESIVMSPGGTVFVVAVQRRLLLMGFSHSRPDIRPGVRISCGHMYTRAILDTEPLWTASTSYHCSFLRNESAITFGQTYNENMISVWKIVIEDGFPSEVNVSHWLHPNVEQTNQNQMCTFRSN